MDESTITFFLVFSFILYLLDTADLPGCWLNTPFRVSKATLLDSKRTASNGLNLEEPIESGFGIPAAIGMSIKFPWKTW